MAALSIESVLQTLVATTSSLAAHCFQQPVSVVFRVHHAYAQSHGHGVRCAPANFTVEEEAFGRWKEGGQHKPTKRLHYDCMLQRLKRSNEQSQEQPNGRREEDRKQGENRNCRPANEQANHPTKDGRGGEGGGWQEEGTDRTTLG